MSMIKVHVEFDKNKVSCEFETFDEVHSWLDKLSVLKKDKKKKMCIGFMNKEDDVCELEDEDENEEKEND